MVIRMRHTRAHTANRRSHHALKAPTLSVCSNCGAKHRPHHMCLECGFYNGKMIVDMKAKKAARQARLDKKREAMQSMAEAQDSGSMPENDKNESLESVSSEKTKGVKDPNLTQQKDVTPRRGEA